MFECGDENDQREVETGTKNAKKSTETVGKKSTTAADDVYEGPASSPELKTDDDYEPSSAADSSDSEEWLSKDKLKSGTIFLRPPPPSRTSAKIIILSSS